MATDLLEREQQAGNESDSFNPGQKNSDATFQKKNAPQSEIDDDFDSIISDNYGDNKQESKVNAHGETIKSNYNADDPEPSDDLKEKEEAGGQSLYGSSGPKKSEGFWGNLKGKAKNAGPSAGITGLILGGFGAMSVLLLPASLLVALEKAVTNDGSDSTRTNIIMRRAYIGGILGDKSNNDKPIKKKATSVSNSQKSRFEKLGFKVDATEENGRFKINSITSPDGKVKMTTGKQFNAWADSSLKNRTIANKVVNTRAAYFQNAKFKKVLGKFNISKSKLLKASKDKDKAKRAEAINKSFDENTGLADKDATEGKVKAHVKDKAKGPAGRIANNAKRSANPINTAVAIACSGYNATRIAVATVKAKWIYDLVSFAFPFIQAAAQIEDQGNIEPEVVENLADRLTWYQKSETADTDEEKSKVNLTAMDSQGLQMAIYGDFTKLQEFTKKYTTGYIGAAVLGSQALGYVQNLLGKENIRDICRLNGWASLALAGQCATGGPASIAICVAAAAAAVGLAYAFGDDILMAFVDQVSEGAIKLIAAANLNSSLRGVDAGNALAAGVGLMLASSSMGYGLRPSSSVGKVKQFITATDDLNYKYGEELARYEARDTPLDVYNQYSFAGQIVSSLSPYRSNDNALYSQFVNMFGVITSSLSHLSPSANALYSQPSNMTLETGSADNRTAKCDDKEMADIGAVCDWSGRMIGYTSPKVLEKMSKQANNENSAIVDTIDYMLANDYIDENGKATGDTNAKGADGDEEKDEKKYDYIKYKNYCTEDRVDPLGTSSRGVEEGSDDDQLWYSGERCLGKEDRDQDMLDHFAIYFNFCESQVPTADETENCWDTQAAPAQAAQTCTGGWTFPVDRASTTFTSGFGARWGAQHQGVDLAGPIGTPVVAACAGTVSAAGAASGFGQWVVIDHDINGKKYSTVYGHIDTYSVAVGDNVSAGQQIATRGNQGQSTGPHLHFEIWDGGRFSGGTAIDPAPELGLGSPSA